MTSIQNEEIEESTYLHPPRRQNTTAMNKLIEENKLSDISSESFSDSNSSDKDQNENEVFKVKNGRFIATKKEKMKSNSKKCKEACR